MSEKENNCSNSTSKCSSDRSNDLSLKEHWENSYEKTDHSKLGWYQESAAESLALIKSTGISKDEKIIDIGSGASVLIDDLLISDYTNIIATDISEKALESTKKRLAKSDLEKVSWIIDDLTKPSKLKDIKEISVWHDRAVFHFLTKEEDRNTYFDLLNKSVKTGKYVIIATFNLNGAKKCSGLDVKRYDEKGIAAFLGENFQLIDFFDFDYTMPSGNVRPYVYTLFRKNK